MRHVLVFLCLMTSSAALGQAPSTDNINNLCEWIHHNNGDDGRKECIAGFSKVKNFPQLMTRSQQASLCARSHKVADYVALCAFKLNEVRLHKDYLAGNVPEQDQEQFLRSAKIDAVDQCAKWTKSQNDAARCALESIARSEVDAKKYPETEAANAVRRKIRADAEAARLNDPILRNCRTEWKEDYEMIEYCVKKQRAAMQHLGID